MVLRRTLPSRVSAEPENTGAPAVPPAPAQAQAPAPQAAPKQETPSRPTSPEAQNAAIAAALDEDFPTPAQAAASTSLEASFTAPAPQPQPAPTPAMQPEMPAETQTAPQPEPEPAPAPAPRPTKPSRPAENTLKPKVREKKPRNFAFTPAASPSESPTAPAEQAFTQTAPDAVEQDNADPRAAADRLETYGLLTEPADALTAAAAPAPAVDESPLPAAPVAEQPQTVAQAAPAAPYVSAKLKDDEPELPPAPPPAAQSATPAPAADLPWAAAAASSQGSAEANDDWGFTPQSAAEAATADANPFGSSAPPIDIYAPQAGVDAVPNPYTATPPVLPTSTPRKSAPELPRAGGNPRSLPGGAGMFQWGIGAAVVVAVAVGVYQLVKNDASQERVARLTGALTETTERLPAELGGVQSNPGGDLVAPEQVIAMDGSNAILPPPPADAATAFQPLPPATAPASSTALIDFADVPPSEVGKPIVADGSEQLPQDVGLFAKIQQAVAAEKARQAGETGAPTPAGELADQSHLTPAEKEMQNTALEQKLHAELAAYRETLATAEKPSEAPKPSEFLRQDQTAAAPAQTATLAPPVATPAEQANPANLPILPEPTSQNVPPVRTLSDFDVEAFEADKERVRIPKGIRPRFSSTDFPEMEVLSFVPGRGIIAFNRGREGVLLIGESLEGWELMNVTPDSAEFRNGRRTQYVSAE